jgi:hypothetical protein
MPRSYMAFTPNRTRLCSDYPNANAEHIVELIIPSMPDDHATIAVVDSSGNFVDSISYNDQMHSALIRDPEGVSLERISMTSASLDPNNWRSAAESEGYATPGFQNSNYRSADGELNEEDVTVVPEVISFNGPSTFTLICYRFIDPGNYLTCRIFDQQGHLIRELAIGTSVGYEGFLRWDGDRDDGGRARPGHYTVLLECFNTSGDSRTIRKRVVIAPR